MPFDSCPIYTSDRQRDHLAMNAIPIQTSAAFLLPAFPVLAFSQITQMRRQSHRRVLLMLPLLLHRRMELPQLLAPTLLPHILSQHTLNPKFKISAKNSPAHTTTGPVTASKSIPLLVLISLLLYV